MVEVHFPLKREKSAARCVRSQRPGHHLAITIPQQTITELVHRKREASNGPRPAQISGEYPAASPAEETRFRPMDEIRFLIKCPSGMMD
jgi:hypothetical protein